ncbi:sensor histidine kinase [Massilia sp. Root418]|uniref:sensor histidine kinase n=1 Tax=Massilia sp. Root418 TaxID=1736532 RepID=UPI0009EBE765|nr:sensor histidine kinase [Massilia sp. Root418]
MSRKVHFITHADLKNIIGQDLINDDNIAIVELVKNSIDAGAQQVNIEFRESEIIIEDNGTGMSADDIEKKWLNIAYSEKKDAALSTRALAGNKGVGRFACDRLGEKLDMFTRKEDTPLEHLAVDWTQFENKKELTATIQKVDITLKQATDSEVQEITGRSPPKTGTTLIISRLRQSWTRDKLMLLKRSLERFMNPIAVFDSDSVEVSITAKSELIRDAVDKKHNTINGKIENQIFSKLKFKTTYIESKIDAAGKTITTQLFHDGEQIYRLVEINEDFKLLKDINVIIHYMNPYKKAYFKRQTGLNLVDFGSVFLFINGYRVPPYGDRDNDWLQLDNRKNQGTARFLGNRELLGLIEVADKSRSFRIVSNREGVAKDDRFMQLYKHPGGFFFHILSKFERFVVDGLDWDSVPESIRKKLRSGVIPGDEDMPETEVYSESGELKRRRVALSLLRIVGASADNTLELDIDPDVLNALSKEKEETVNALLEKFDTFTGAMGHDLKLALHSVQNEFRRQRESLSRAKKEIARKEVQVTRLKDVARGISQQKDVLQSQIRTQQTELHFARLSAGTDQEQLMLLHHQSGIYANTAKNFLDLAISQLRKGADAEKIIEAVEKALLGTRKIIAVTNFATKANFRLKTETMTADIASFIKEYMQNVAGDSSAQNLKVTVRQDSPEPFVMRFKPIDVAIVFDNLASNSTRARAKKFDVEIIRPSENELIVKISDDGPGISPDIQPPENVFDRGVTTTNGSGLGLYHVKQTVKQLNGDISLGEASEKGFCVIMRLLK